MFSLDFLKFRERDQLIDILKFWLKNSENNYKMDLAKIWDNRLRQHLEIRYDSRFGVFDWDYNMNLINKGANVGIISLHEYKTWRNTGIAFGEYEADYSQPNLTLTSGKKCFSLTKSWAVLRKIRFWAGFEFTVPVKAGSGTGSFGALVLGQPGN